MTQQMSAAADVREHEVGLSAQMSLGDGRLTVRYAVENHGQAPIVLLNYVRQPGFEPEQDPDRAFVEVDADGTVLITQRAIDEGDEPSSKRPQHRAILVEAGATHRHEFALPLPLTHANPEEPSADVEIPDPPRKACLRLGYAPASRFDEVVLSAIRAANGDLRTISPDLGRTQTLLRSAVIGL